MVSPIPGAKMPAGPRWMLWVLVVVSLAFSSIPSIVPVDAFITETGCRASNWQGSHTILNSAEGNCCFGDGIDASSPEHPNNNNNNNNNKIVARKQMPESNQSVADDLSKDRDAGNPPHAPHHKKTNPAAAAAARGRIPGTDARAVLLDRRGMASVATGRALAFASSFALLGYSPLPSQASTTRQGSPLSPPASLPPSAAAPASSEATTGLVRLPLEFVPTLGAYVVRYTLFGENFAAIVDTGSPFLTVPSYCRPYRNKKMFWGCYRPELTSDSGYENTIEGFDNNYGA